MQQFFWNADFLTLVTKRKIIVQLGSQMNAVSPPQWGPCLQISETIVHFKKTQKKLFANNPCALALQTLKFLTKKETMVTDIFASSSSPNFYSRKSNVKKKCLLFSIFANFPCKIEKFELEVAGVGIFQGQEFKFRVAINKTCREIAVKIVTLISPLLLISVKVVLLQSIATYIGRKD